MFCNLCFYLFKVITFGSVVFFLMYFTPPPSLYYFLPSGPSGRVSEFRTNSHADICSYPNPTLIRRNNIQSASANTIQLQPGQTASEVTTTETERSVTDWHSGYCNRVFLCCSIDNLTSVKHCQTEPEPCESVRPCMRRVIT